MFPQLLGSQDDMAKVRVSDREKKAVRSVMKELFRTTVLSDRSHVVL